LVALKARAVDRFVGAPDAGIDAFLVYGPDRGLVAEQLRRLIDRFAPDAGDPFATSQLDEAAIAREPQRLADELASFAFGGGRRAVIVRGLGTGTPAAIAAAAGAIAAAVAAPTAAVLMVEGGDLKPGSALRKAFEASKTAAALPCYAGDDRDIAALINQGLTLAGQTISEPARSLLGARLGPDRLVNRSEIDKLSLYAGPGARIEVEDVEAVSADASAATLEEVVDAMAEGAADRLEAGLAKARAGAITPAQLVRAAGGHMARLHVIAAARSSGADPGSVIGRMRPPLHFLRKDSLTRQLARWSETDLRGALAAIGEAEPASRIALPSAALVERALFRVARMAGAARRG
jgi:DNA polymerase-3 subunit delta